MVRTKLSIIILLVFLGVLSTSGYGSSYKGPPYDRKYRYGDIVLFVRGEDRSKGTREKLKAISEQTAMEAISAIYYLNAFFIDGRTYWLDYESPVMVKNIKSLIEEVDGKVYAVKEKKVNIGELDPYWRGIVEWAVTSDSFAGHSDVLFEDSLGNLIHEIPGDTVRYRQGVQHAYSTLESMLTNTNQNERRPELLLWLGYLSGSLSLYSESEKYYRTVLAEFGEQKERAFIAEYNLGYHSLRRQGKVQEGDSILAGITKKYASLKDYKELVDRCGRYQRAARVDLKAISGKTAVKVDWAIFTYWDCDIFKTNHASYFYTFGANDITNKVTRMIAALDSSVFAIKERKIKSKDLDPYWRGLAEWAMASDSLDTSDFNNADSTLYVQALKPIYAFFDTLMRDPNQESKRPEILLWLGYWAGSLGLHSEQEKDCRMFLARYPGLREKCLVAEYRLGRCLIKQGRKREGRSILSQIPKKYKQLKDYQSMFIDCLHSGE